MSAEDPTTLDERLAEAVAEALREADLAGLAFLDDPRLEALAAGALEPAEVEALRIEARARWGSEAPIEAMLPLNPGAQARLEALFGESLEIVPSHPISVPAPLAPTAPPPARRWIALGMGVLVVAGVLAMTLWRGPEGVQGVSGLSEAEPGTPTAASRLPPADPEPPASPVARTAADGGEADGGAPDAASLEKPRRPTPSPARRSPITAQLEPPSPAEERLVQIRSRLNQSHLLSTPDRAWLEAMGAGDPGYGEGHRLLAVHYGRRQDHRRQAEALEAATRRGPLRHDPRVLLSLARAYGHQRRYLEALRAVRRAEAKMRDLPAEARAEVLALHAELLELRFLEQLAADPAKAPRGLVDRAIHRWRQHQALVGAGPTREKGRRRIRELQALKEQAGF